MKDANDKVTQEMFNINNTTTSQPAPRDERFRFYLTTIDGVVLVWTHLSRTQAIQLNKLAEKLNVLQSSTEVKCYGWEQM